MFGFKDYVQSSPFAALYIDTTHTAGYTDAWIIKTDTNNYKKVYPNPANTEIPIMFTDPKQSKIDFIELLDSKGTNLQAQQVNNQTYTLSTAHLSNGMYYLAAYFNGNKRVV